MSTGYFNSIDVAPAVLPNTITKAYQTQEAMLDDWQAFFFMFVISTFFTPGTSSWHTVATTDLIVLDKDITEKSLTGRICSASPEQRDYLAKIINATQSVPSDIKLLTQEQLLSDPSCVDVYVTAVQQPSPFISRLTSPMYMRSFGQQAAFPAQSYPSLFNVDPVQVDTQPLFLCI